MGISLVIPKVAEACSNSSWTRKAAHRSPDIQLLCDFIHETSGEKLSWTMCSNSSFHFGVVWSRFFCAGKTRSVNVLQRSRVLMYLCSGGQWGFHLLSSSTRRWLCGSLAEHKKGCYKLFYKVITFLCAYIFQHILARWEHLVLTVFVIDNLYCSLCHYPP